MIFAGRPATKGVVRNSQDDYPIDAYAVDGVLWWELEFHPGKRIPYGGERKLAAWLAFNLDVGDQFSMPELRDALGTDAVPNNQEHLNRRLRKLREDGWVLTSNSADKSLETGVYRIDQMGWHPGLGARPKQDSISKATERAVFKRDGGRCVICGVGKGEPYIGKPDSHAVITVGDRQTGAHKGLAKDIDNLETQCALHNEPVREEVLPESIEEVILDLKRLNDDELDKLETWLEQGYRSRDRLDQIHDRARALSPRERDKLVREVRKQLGGEDA